MFLKEPRLHLLIKYSNIVYKFYSITKLFYFYRFSTYLFL